MAFCYSLVNSNKNIYSLIRKTINQQTEKYAKWFLKDITHILQLLCCFWGFLNLKEITKTKVLLKSAG